MTFDSGPFRTVNDSLVEDLDNIQFRKNGNNFEVWTIKDIQINEELFVSYKKHHWWYRPDRHPSRIQAITARHGKRPKNLNCILAVTRTLSGAKGGKRLRRQPSSLIYELFETTYNHHHIQRRKYHRAPWNGHAQLRLRCRGKSNARTLYAA